jgi:hypothetical protein
LALPLPGDLLQPINGQEEVMSFVFYGLAGPQHTVYGINHENITPRLTRLNWKTKAIVRNNRQGSLYLWIARGQYTDAEGHKQCDYFIRVNASQAKEHARRFEAQFQYLVDALRYINGEDGGLLAQEASPTQTSEGYPVEQEAPYYIAPVKIISQE